jgi:hypothetical protein
MDNFKNYENRFLLWSNIINEYSLLNNCKVNILEIGVWGGQFARHILDNCECVNKYYLIDPYRNLTDWNKPLNISNEAFETIYKEMCDKLSNYKDKTILLRGKTDEVIDKIDNNTLDIIYIDGDHTFNGITTDITKSLCKIKNGGIIGGDDYVENIYHHGSKYSPTMVKKVIDDFVTSNNSKISKFITNNSQFLIKVI